ncbi:UNVERIFIED_CONTAM: hypothetical protein Sindi_2892700 [Sesamum indicum]
MQDYAHELLKSNPGSTVVVGVDADQKFDKFYVCFGALKNGFNGGCRQVVGVDGCHLKGPFGGVLLTAVGIDPNNNIYPVAYAVVGKEMRVTWEWFLRLLKSDLGVVRDDQWCFISDKQKGLVQAFEEVFPASDHRFCVRHLHSNLKNAGFRGLAFKNCLWKAARATTLNEFKLCMKQMSVLDKTAAEWFNDKPPTQWSRSHFKTDIKCDVLLNNCCETFNSNILEAREKPIVTMLEWIREYLMRRLQENRDRAELKWTGVICPRIVKIIEKNVEKSADCIPIKADSSHYQLNCFDGSQHSVDLDKRSCSCRKWNLNGIPCKHACSAILCKGDDPIKYVNECYSVASYKNVYKTAIMPMVGRDLWTATQFIPPLPPNFGRGAGRPPKSRRREPDEIVSKQKKNGKGKPQNRLKRVQKTVKCPLKNLQEDTQVTDAFSQVIQEIKEKEAHESKKRRVEKEAGDKDILTKNDVFQGDNSMGMQEQISIDEMTKADAFEENKSMGMKEQELPSTAVHHTSQQTAASVIPKPFKPPRYKQKVAHKQPWKPSYKSSTSQQENAAQNSRPPPPTQPSHLQPPIQKVNIRAPPRWIGRQEVFPKQPLQPETKSLLSTCTFLEKDGKKYVTLSRLNNVLSQSKDKGNKEDKGKKKDGRNSPFV